MIKKLLSAALLSAAALLAAEEPLYSVPVLGDFHYDRLELHDEAFIREKYPRDRSQIINYTKASTEFAPLLLDAVAGQVNAGTPFVIQLGDFTEGLCGSRELQDRMFRGAIEQVKAKIKVPFLVTKGNHDITGPGAKESYRETLLPLAEELREKWQTLQQGRAGGGWGTSLEEVLQNAVTSLSRRVVGWLGGIASSLPSILFTLTFTVLSTIFFLQDYAGITGFIVRSLPGRWLRPMVESKRYLLGAVQKVLFAYLCIMFITFGEITLGLWLLRVPYFAAIAFAIALLDILPFIGSGLFLIPWGAYHLLISRQTALGAGLLLLYAVVTVVRMWLEPRIVGGRIGLHPLATLTAMYAGLKIFGFWGLLLAPLGTTLLLHLRQGGYLRGEG